MGAQARGALAWTDATFRAACVSAYGVKMSWTFGVYVALLRRFTKQGVQRRIHSTIIDYARRVALLSYDIYIYGGRGGPRAFGVRAVL